MKTIERIEISVKKITSDNDVQSLLDAIATLRVTIIVDIIIRHQRFNLSDFSNDLITFFLLVFNLLPKVR